MDLEKECEKYGYTFANVWRPYAGTGTVLKLDSQCSYGAFAEACKGVEFAEGEGVPGRAFTSKDVEYCANLQLDGRDSRKAAAKEADIKGCFAVRRPALSQSAASSA